MITFGCAYHCWQDIPDYSVYNVLKGAQLQEALADGIIRVSDIPDHVSITGKKSIDVDAFRNDEVYVDKASIREFLKTLEYPLYFLDYETIYPAIPFTIRHRLISRYPFSFLFISRIQKAVI